MKLSTGLLMVIFLVFAISSIIADIPRTINYQGRLTDSNGDPLNGSYFLSFRIYNQPTGGSMLYFSGSASIQVTDGLFQVELGSSPFADLDLTTLLNDTACYLAVKVGTDPEITPRSRLTSSLYSLSSIHADSLGGKTASDFDTTGHVHDASEVTSGTLHWSRYNSYENLENDDYFLFEEQNHIATRYKADSSYINIHWDTMSGNLQFDYDKLGDNEIQIRPLSDGGEIYLFQNGINSARLYGSFYGTLSLFDPDGDLTASLDATSNFGGRLRLYDNSGTQQMYLNAGTTGDDAVILPENSINSLEMENETGLTSAKSFMDHTLIQNTVVTVAQTSITIPEDGYILVFGDGTASLWGSADWTTVLVQINSFQGAALTGGHSLSISDHDLLTGQFKYRPFSTHRVFYETAGTYTYYLESLYNTSPADPGLAYITDPRITAIYIPTSYGSVSTILPNPPTGLESNAVSKVNQDGSTQTAYEVDLRQLELQAKEAEIEALKAKMRYEEARERSVNNK